MKLLRDSPAVHVVALGVLVAAALFLVRGRPVEEEDRSVVVTASDLAQLRATWMRQWRRPPTEQELRGVLEAHIRQEVLYREALARGYDRDDPVMRNAMQRKMEFLGEAQVSAAEVTEEEARAFYALRRDQYRVPGQVSFAQLFFGSDVAGHPAEVRARAALQRVREAPDAPGLLATLGDSTMLAPRHASQSQKDVAAVFGAAFAEAVFELEPGEWQGPISSGYGLHLVRVLEQVPPRDPPWSLVRDRVVNDILFESRKAAREQFFQEVVQTYRIALTDAAQAMLEEPPE